MGTAFLGAGAQICINRGLQLEKAGPATSMRFLDIILSYIWQVWILHEKTDGYSIVGAVLVSVCLIMMGMKKWWNVRKARLAYEQSLEIKSLCVCWKGVHVWERSLKWKEGMKKNRRKRHPFKRQPVFVPNGVHLLVGHDAATRLPQL